MSFDRRALARSNAVLARADGELPPYEASGRAILPDGIHPRYQWCWSQELMTATPKLTANGDPEIEFICGCGTDVAIHASNCGLTIGSVKFIPWPVDPFLNANGDSNCFALCQWTPPPSREYWAENYGSFRYYPNKGVYRPLQFRLPEQIRSTYLSFPYPFVPREDTTLHIIGMIKDHYAHSVERLLKMDDWQERNQMVKTKDFTPPVGSKWDQMHDAAKDIMTLDGHRPGEKTSVSYPTPKLPMKPLIEIATR
jgi:hypothetical protein